MAVDHSDEAAFATWLAEHGFAVERLTVHERSLLRSAWQAERFRDAAGLRRPVPPDIRSKG